MQIFVLGMHGSGTSMLARLLNMMGVYFAPEHACTGSDQENSKGFWERRDVRQANDRLLQANRGDWDRVGSFSTEKIPEEELKRVQKTIRSIVLELDAHRPWFVKEPRLCLLFPVWRPLLELPVCIHIYRHPLEVALSLRERNQLSVPLGLALWERYTLAAFGATAGLPRVLVPHAKLLEFPVKTLRWLAARLTEFGVRGLREPAEVEIEAFVRSDLHHHRLSAAFGAGNCLREHHQNLIELIDSGAILECGSDDLPAVSAYTMDLLAVHDSAWQKVAQQMEKLRENIVAVEKTLEDRSWRFGCNIAALQRTIEKKEAQLRALQKPVEALRRQLQQAEALRDRWQKEFAKLNEWSERILRDFGRVLRSNRWRIGNWLSFKRAGEKSKEAHRLAQLIASRPRPASGTRYPAQVQSPTGKGDPDRTGGALSNSDNRSACPTVSRVGSSAAATPQQHVARDLLNPLLDRGRGPKPLPEAVGRGGQSSVTEKADVIVCVHNALEDVRRCLGSIVKHRSARLNKLILVNDGSDEETTSYLRQFVAEAPVKTALLENPQPGGYTKAANRGLAARQAKYAILLNSDTVVTPGWIERLMACGESDPSIGIIGPISNAAGWQSVPERYSRDGDWAVNELPLSSLDRISSIFSILHIPQYPRVPLVNGFCFGVKSTVIDAIGLLDEKLFPNGYGEENDYCLRAGKAGFSGAIADDCYLFHAKSRSYSHETRRELSGQAQLILRQKYGAEVDQATTVLRNSPELAQARSVFARVVGAPPCSILFLMNLRAAGGGVNSIVQEANGLRKLGAAVQVAIRRQDESFYRERFPGVAGNLFHVSESMAELIGYARHFEFVVATAFKTVRTLKTLLEQASGVVPCYYIQDYEPNFCHPSEANYPEAVESYTLIPEMRCFAKTRWLCETVAKKHGLHVHKVEPSIDRNIFFSDNRPKPGTPFVVCAMVRPVSEYRSPGLTFEILRRIKREFGQRVEIRMFGLEQNDPFLARQRSDFEYEVLGILDRQGVAKLMRESSLFIDASTYQAFGRTGLEAMACHCATILPSQGGISEYAVDGVNTLQAAPNDAGEVLRKVTRYISEPQLYQSILKEGLKTAARYSIEKACVSELRFFESLRQSTGAERSAALWVARSKSPAAVPMHRYAVVDLGTKKGGAIDAFRRFAASNQMPAPSPALCLGIDRDEQYRTEVTQKGYEFLAANIISPDFVWPEADHYLALDFLEHLPDREWSKKVLIQMCRHATAGVWLRLPSFEQDSVTGEGALKKHGLRFAWSHWSGHPSHFLVEDAMQALYEGLKDAQWSHRLEQRKLIHDSNHADVVPIGAPINTVKYDPNLGMRPQVQFVPPIVGQWELIVSIQRKASEPRPGAPRAAHVTSLREPRGFVTHPETWMGHDELGRERPYQPTITSFGEFINDRHRYYHECPTKGILIDVGIQGHLLREDALKLYEMAYYARGDILEFGTSFGLSTSILARAVRDAGRDSRIVTMELKQRLAEHARHTLTGLDLSRYIEFMVGDADASCQKLVDTGRRFHFAFVDHSHTYDDVSKACRRLPQLLTPGSFCLFHDYNSRWEGTADYGVYTAVAHALDKNQFEFCGIYGCCGLFRRRDA